MAIDDMHTSTLLRQAMHELEAAMEEAVLEYGPRSPQVLLISDALVWMRDWMRHYIAAAQRDQPPLSGH